MNDKLSEIELKISQMESRRQILEKKILNMGSLIKGSYFERYMACGKPNCKCLQGEKHGPIPWITGKYRDKTISTSIPAENITEVKEMAVNYKEFRNAQKEIRKINGDIDKLNIQVLQIKEYNISEKIKKRKYSLTQRENILP